MAIASFFINQTLIKIDIIFTYTSETNIAIVSLIGLLTYPEIQYYSISALQALLP